MQSIHSSLESDGRIQHVLDAKATLDAQRSQKLSQEMDHLSQRTAHATEQKLSILHDKSETAHRLSSEHAIGNEERRQAVQQHQHSHSHGDLHHAKSSGSITEDRQFSAAERRAELLEKSTEALHKELEDHERKSQHAMSLHQSHVDQHKKSAQTLLQHLDAAQSRKEELDKSLGMKLEDEKWNTRHKEEEVERRRQQILDQRVHKAKESEDPHRYSH